MRRTNKRFSKSPKYSTKEQNCNRDNAVAYVVIH